MTDLKGEVILHCINPVVRRELQIEIAVVLLDFGSIDSLLVRPLVEHANYSLVIVTVFSTQHMPPTRPNKSGLKIAAKVGLPLVVMILGGSVLLSKFMESKEYPLLMSLCY